LAREREAEPDDFLIGSSGEHAGTSSDPPFPVQVAVRAAGEPGLELVGAPSEEWQVGVTIHEAGNDGAPLEANRISPAQAVRSPRVRDDAVLPGHRAGPHFADGLQLRASDRFGTVSPGHDRRAHDRAAV